MKKKNSQMSSSLAVGILLALAGGFMDAYSYMARGHVFANAQTGNILLFAVAISEGRPADSLRYLLPVVSFALGIALAAAMRTRFGHMSRLHWRQLTLLVEILILFGVSFFPAGQHLWANSLTSLACGIQVQAFRKIEGNGIATTMCIGTYGPGCRPCMNITSPMTGRSCAAGRSISASSSLLRWGPWPAIWPWAAGGFPPSGGIACCWCCPF